MPGPRDKNVQISFEGLMIGRSTSPTYQIGILPAPDHEFRICYRINGVPPLIPVSPLPTDGLWFLEVPGAAPRVDLFHSTETFNRFSPDESDDFDWVLHVGNELEFPAHPQPVGLKNPSRLKPTIEIRNGVLFNRVLSAMLHQQLHNGPAIPFGRATKIVGLGIDVPVGQEVVLRNAIPDGIIHFPVVAGTNLLEIFINNTDNLPTDTAFNPRADFFNYYTAFDIPSRNKHYEFWKLIDPDDALEPASVAAQQTSTVCPGENVSGNPGPLCGMADLG